MANHRPKSLSELNNVYDKAMRAERAIKEGSSLLSVPETKETPQSENIFQQLESKAAQAEKNQVFDPDITNIANDFLKRYAQAEKPKAAPKEIKRPAPSIQSVYHTAHKPKQEEKQDVSLSLNESPAISFDPPAVPLHKPAPTVPAAQSEPAYNEVPAESVPEVREAPVSETPLVTAPQTVVTESRPASSDIPADTYLSEKPQINTAKPSAPRPVHKAPSRVRITSTERNELMEEYLRVMSDEEDDDDTYKKPKFSFFKKKKKYEEEFTEEPMADLYEELAEEDEVAEEIPVVPFDNSNVKYTDEYSDAPTEDETPISQEQMNIYDYIEADFDYDEDEYSDYDEEARLDVSFAVTKEETPETLSEENAEVSDEAEENALEESAEEIKADDVIEELAEEQSEETDEITVSQEAEDISEESENQESQEVAEAVIIPEEETEPVLEASPTADMVFEDIFSVTDESKRSHNGGNWEEVFGEKAVAAPADENAAEDYSEYTPDSEEEYVEIYEESEPSEYAEAYEETEEDESAEEDFEEEASAKGGFLVKFITVFVAVICILGAAATLLISALLDVNSGNLVSERFRVFSVPQNLSEVGLSANTLVITENIYAHVDDVYVFVNEENGAYEFGKVTASIPGLSGDYLYLTASDSGTKAINRDKSMGVVIATYAGVGGILTAICDYYIFIAGALLILAVAMIVCLILFSKKLRRSVYTTQETQAYDEPADASEYDSSTDDSDTDYSDTDEYYSDYDTDGIEQGLFSDI